MFMWLTSSLMSTFFGLLTLWYSVACDFSLYDDGLEYIYVCILKFRMRLQLLNYCLDVLLLVVRFGRVD